MGNDDHRASGPERVSIIIVNFRDAASTADLLESLKTVTYPWIEVLVVDNGSRDDSMAREVLRFPFAQLLSYRENLGYAGAFNAAVEHASGALLLLLNNDLVVDPGFLEPLVEALEADEALGLVSPKILQSETPSRIQYAGYRWASRLGVRHIAIGKGEKDGPDYRGVRATDFAHGAAMMVRRSTFERVGGIPGEYFLYYEELDWSVRVVKSGFKIACVGESVVYHAAARTTGKRSALRTYYLTRNRVLFARRCLPPVQRTLAITYLFTLVLVRELMRSKKASRRRAVVDAYLWHLGLVRTGEGYPIEDCLEGASEELA